MQGNQVRQLQSMTEVERGHRMAIPGSSDARLDYRCAFQRDEEAEILMTSDETKMSFANLDFDDPIPSKL